MTAERAHKGEVDALLYENSSKLNLSISDSQNSMWVKRLCKQAQSKLLVSQVGVRCVMCVRACMMCMGLSLSVWVCGCGCVCVCVCVWWGGVYE